MPSLSFVLLDSPRRVDAAAIERVYGERFPGAPSLRSDVAEDAGATFHIGDQLTVVSAMDAAIPTDEAQSAARLSLFAYGPDGPVDASRHGAHLMVTSMASGRSVEGLRDHTRIVAATALAHDALGIYEGNAVATHPPGPYADCAVDDLPIMLWTGISLAPEADGASSLLSLGLGQFELPDLWVIARAGEGNAALAFLLDLAAYTIRREDRIGEGETVGRSNEERIAVRYVESPDGSGREVALIDLRGDA